MPVISQCSISVLVMLLILMLTNDISLLHDSFNELLQLLTAMHRPLDLLVIGDSRRVALQCQSLSAPRLISICYTLQTQQPATSQTSVRAGLRRLFDANEWRRGICCVRSICHWSAHFVYAVGRLRYRYKVHYQTTPRRVKISTVGAAAATTAAHQCMRALRLGRCDVRRVSIASAAVAAVIWPRSCTHFTRQPVRRRCYDLRLHRTPQRQYVNVNVKCKFI